MNKKQILTFATILGIAGSGFANIEVLENPTFTGGTDPWMAGSNSFIGGVWQAYISDGYTVDERVTVDGDTIVYTSWDDGASDTLENFLLQEWGAGPVGSATETEFNAGDVFVFKGMASAVTEGRDPSDVVVRAFIKMLGYNEFGWSHQVKPDYTRYFVIGPEMEAFELTVTFPDLAVDDSFQIIQMGFEITVNYDSVSETMDSGAITFKNLEGYIVSEGGSTWNGYAVDENGWADTDSWLGWVNVSEDPWIISASFGGYFYMPASQNTDNGGWAYILK